MKFTVGRKLWSGFLAVLLLLVVVGSIGFYSQSNMNKEYRFMIDNQVTKMMLLENLASTQYKSSNDVRGFLLFEKVSFLKNLKELEESFNTQFGILNQMASSTTEQELLDELKASRESYVKNTDMAISEFNNANDEKALNIASDASIFQAQIEENINELIDYQTEQTNQVEESITKLIVSSHMLTLGLIAVAILLSIAVAAVISRSIARPVGKMTDALAEIADGNFAIDPVIIRNKDEIGDMAIAFNGMAKDLRGIISNANESALQLAAQAEEVSASSEESLAASEMVARTTEKNLLGSESQAAIVGKQALLLEKWLRGLIRLQKIMKQCYPHQRMWHVLLKRVLLLWRMSTAK